MGFTLSSLSELLDQFRNPIYYQIPDRMTVSYTAEVANASSFGCFTPILFRWKGSLYKLIFKELFVYLTIYAFINIFYFVVLLQDGLQNYRQIFEAAKAYCSIQTSSIPMTFGLGFYVSIIVKRWWDQYQLLPWPDSLAIFIVGLLEGMDERSRMMRRNIMRYTLLSYVITLRRISFRVRKRFPTMQHVVDAGLMRSDELKCMELMDEKCSVSKWWMPLVWATHIVDMARKEQKIKSDPAVQTILKEISSIRAGLTGVQHYDTISVPLVYTQVVTLAVYSYFAAALMGAQWVIPESQEDYKTTYKLPTFKHETVDGEFGYQPINLYFPFFLMLQFIFYVGWLKVAEILINPFGEDDDDFELNYIIDRHFRVAYMIVDEMHDNNPELLKDIHWNETVPNNLPYTEDTAHYRKEEPKGGAEKIFDEDLYGYSNYSKYGFLRRMSSNRPTSARKSSNISLSKTLTNGNAVMRPVRGGDPEPSSDYESVDTSIVGWWKNKLRRSQIRKSGFSVASSHSNFPHRKSTKSLKSQKSNYGRIFSSNANNTPKLSVTSNTDSNHPPTTGEHLGTAKEEQFQSTPNLDHSSKNPIAMVTDDEDSFDNEYDFSRFRNQSHLTTITENQNSPYSTHNGSRRNSRPYPNAEGLFESSSTPPFLSKSFSDQGSTNYYPLSETQDEHLNPFQKEGGDINKDDTFNYEEVSFNRQDKDSDPGLILKPKRHFELGASPAETLKIPSYTSPSNTPNTSYGNYASPALPKRQARLAFDSIKLSKAMESFVKPNDSVTEVKNKILDDMDEMDVKDEEERRSLGERKSHPEDNTKGQKKSEESIASAFDNATFYV
ncbi:uncharacterized protein [Lepeophtheirus salmonis]|uniref:uncharacterized protein isoform X1 n=2 Tax=Lepeophtheirus salmonis TaxID=72036 RepID=UPI003AF3F8A9